jgi:hypothetical protein
VTPGIARTVFEAVVTAFFIGAVMGTVVVLNSGDGGGRPPLLGAVAIGAFASAFVSIPLGVVSGAAMTWVMRRERGPRTRSAWMGTGLMVGAGIGGIGSAAISAASTGLDEFATLFFLATGGLAGGIAGVVLGLWCARHTRATG